MSITLEKANQILNEKKAKIIPGNIRKGIQIFDISGTYEGGNSDGLVKLYNTSEAMNAATDSTEGDIALVYKNQILKATASDVGKSFTATFLDTIVVPTPVTNTSALNATQIGTNLYYKMSKTLFRLQTSSGLLASALVEYSSTDGTTYTRVNGEETLENVNFTTTPTDNVLAFFNKIDFNFEGLYEYKNNLWSYLDIGIKNLTPQCLLEGIKAYGNTGIIEGDGSIFDNLSAKLALQTIHGTDNVTSEDITIVPSLGGTPYTKSYAELQILPEKTLYPDAGLEEHLNRVMPIKFGTSEDRALFDVLQDYKRLPDADKYDNILSSDGKYSARIEDLTVIVNGQTVTLPGKEWHHASDYCLFNNNLYTFTRDGLTGYITRVSLEDGSTLSLTHSLSASGKLDFADVETVTDIENNRIYFAVWSQDDTTSYADIFWFNMDMSVITKGKTISIAALEKDGYMVISNKGELVIEMKTADTKGYKLYVLNKDTFAEIKTCTYNWTTSGPLLMHNSRENAEMNLIVWHIGDMIYSGVYGDAAELNLATAAFSRESTAIDSDKFPMFHSLKDDLLISGTYNTAKIPNIFGEETWVYSRAIYDYSDNLVTAADIKYESSSILCHSYGSDYPTKSYMTPYFDGTEYKRVYVYEAIHQVGWWKPGTISDYDVLLVPAMMVSDVETIDGIRIENVHTVEYIATYNNTISSVEYNTALETAKDILGEEV